MPAAPADTASKSFAPPTRQRGYITAMRQLAANRPPGAPVRVYLSVPPLITERDNWEERLKAVRTRLPHGVELLTYGTAFADGSDYASRWEEFAAGLDGLVVIAPQKKPGGKVYRLGPASRNELRTVVAAGKPVLLFARTCGLVPVVDCRAGRVGPPHRLRTKLTVPGGWDARTPAPTLQAALAALSPNTSEEPAPPARAAHLLTPFEIAVR
ncbi:hypothetical protein ACH4U6_34890 [Streptomyces netropsis]|uniref:hypothetical protein n=1 Tax=Streptomyces netropsis TaxID=55404 RepID=UPI0037A46170